MADLDDFAWNELRNGSMVSAAHCFLDDEKNHDFDCYSYIGESCFDAAVGRAADTFVKARLDSHLRSSVAVVDNPWSRNHIRNGPSRLLDAADSCSSIPVGSFVGQDMFSSRSCRDHDDFHFRDSCHMHRLHYVDFCDEKDRGSPIESLLLYFETSEASH